MKSLTERVEQKPWLGWMLFAATVAAVFLIGLRAEDPPAVCGCRRFRS